MKTKSTRITAAAIAAGLLVGGHVHAQTLLAGFYDSGTDAVVSGLAANVTATGITATFDGRGRTGTNELWGSGDGTYGTTLGGALVATTETQMASYRSSANFNGATFTITNTTGSAVSIETIAFDHHNNDESTRDYWDNITLTYESGDLAITDGTVINSVTGLARDNTTNLIDIKNGDYVDFDWSLTGLADYTLANGESAVFKINSTYTDTVADNARNFASLDNIGFVGTIGGGSTPADPEITSFTVSGDTATVTMTGDDSVGYWCASSTDLTSFSTEETALQTGTNTPVATNPDGSFNTSGGTLTFDVDVTGDSSLFLRIQNVDPVP